ncbi:hypothetical protein ACKUTL_18815 [Serratia marcescens]|uniref:hypothetical protein n=1 Tax=Serratia marcescens TaxID=615 RepID=UPI001BD5930C|nr:hypothetical protein [Serratia marcescens]
MKTEDAQLVEMLNRVIEWHQSRVDICKAIIDSTIDFELHTRDGGSRIIAADSAEAQWLKVGVGIALKRFKKFPLSLRATDDEDDSDDE